jgi:hypothetical protein
MYDPQDDVVVLDGLRSGRDWPLALAEQVLVDPTPWSKEGPTEGSTQGRAVAEVASCVTWSTRRQISPKIAAERLRRNESLERYSTQELLEMLNAIWRMDHFTGAGLAELEPALRALLSVVVARVRSATPPQFQSS